MKNKFKVPKTIKARNTWFNKLTPDEKRVAIAKDVIDQLDAKKFIAKFGTFFGLDSGNKSVKEGQSLQKVIDKGESCSVCAMGAVFASKVRLGNELNVDDNLLQCWKGFDVEADDEDILESTNNVFSEYDMRLMEFFFEGNDIADYIYEWHSDEGEPEVYDEIDSRVLDFESKYQNSEDRMRAIMQNIIDSEGRFTLHL